MSGCVQDLDGDTVLHALVRYVALECIRCPRGADAYLEVWFEKDADARSVVRGMPIRNMPRLIPLLLDLT